MEYLPAGFNDIRRGWEPTVPCTPRAVTPRKGKRPTLPTLQGGHAQRSTDQIESSADLPEDAILPSGVDSGLDHLMSMLAVEGWADRAGEATPFESQLLSCESRLRRLERMALQLHPPNPVVTAIACDLFRDTLQTLPPVLQELVDGLLKNVMGAVYSKENNNEDIDELKRFVGHDVAKVPYFQIARRQRNELQEMEKQVSEMKVRADDTSQRRKNVVNFISRLQFDERVVLQQWLLAFWTVTFRNRQVRIEAVASQLLDAHVDNHRPFLAWRLFLCQARLDRWRRECETVDAEASQVANRITEVEKECEGQQSQLEERMAESAGLKEQCFEEQAELHRLQRVWEATQPELLLSVLGQSLERFFNIIVRSANFTDLEVRHRHAYCDIDPLVEGFETFDDLNVEQVLVKWINLALATVRDWARDQIKLEDDYSREEAVRLEMVLAQNEINSLKDVSDSVALCALFAVLKATSEGVMLRCVDLWALDERDFELRAEQLFTALQSFARMKRARWLATPADITQQNVQNLTLFLAPIFLHQPLLNTVEEPAHSRWLETLIAKMESCYKDIGISDDLEDPSPLMQGGEDFHSLATVSAEQLLLRWVNVQLRDVYRPVENFGSDLQDGRAIGLLLRKVAPEIMPEAMPDNTEERLEHITAMGKRCTDFELLTVEALLDGQSDIVASFFAQLFLDRPCLQARPESLLAMHLRLLRDICTMGYATLAQVQQPTDIMVLCRHLEDSWADITLAIQTVQDANAMMQGMWTRVRDFLGDTLAHRAHGRPRTMLDAKEAREFLFYTSVNLDRMQVLLSKENITGETLTRTEDLLRKHFRLIRDIFKHYASPVNNSFGITMEGLLRLYNDCKLRSKELAPFHLESIFNEQMDLNKSADQMLSPQNFVEVLIQCANFKLKHCVEHVPDQFAFLIENHLRPNACQDVESIFQEIAYDPRVREVLTSHSQELNLIFQIYADIDHSSVEASQRANTMNIKEFQLLLVHCDLLDELLTESAVVEIFDGIQQGATEEPSTNEDHQNTGIQNTEAGRRGSFEERTSPDKNRDSKNARGDKSQSKDENKPEEGVDDDDELAFSEFLDGLVAITAYKEPNPFIPFANRVNIFIMNLFAELRRHWSRKRGNARVDSLLNSLQKKLRGAKEEKDKKDKEDEKKGKASRGLRGGRMSDLKRSSVWSMSSRVSNKTNTSDKEKG